MAIIVKAISGQSGSVADSEESHVLEYLAWDPDNRNASFADIWAAVSAATPTTFDSLPISDVSYEEDGEILGSWTFSITYSTVEAAEALLRIGFDSTGGTVRVTTSKATTSYPATGRTAPDFKGGIEVSGGEAQGIDITIPALKVVFNYKWPVGSISLTQVRNLAGFTGKVNNASWYGFDAGELLFLGASGEIDPTLPTDIQYTFVASENATGLSIGSAITGIAKQGHQHLWVAFEEQADASAGKSIPRPLAAYVETLYGVADFALFGIGS